MTKAKGRPMINRGVVKMDDTPPLRDIRPREFHDPTTQKVESEDTIDPWLPDEGWMGVVYVRTVRTEESGMLLDFAVGFSIWGPSDDGFVEVERIDTAHAALHIDDYSSGSKVKDCDTPPIEIREDIDRAFVWAKDYIWIQVEKVRGTLG